MYFGLHLGRNLTLLGVIYNGNSWSLHLYHKILKSHKNRILFQGAEGGCELLYALNDADSFLVSPPPSVCVLITVSYHFLTFVCSYICLHWIPDLGDISVIIVDLFYIYSCLYLGCLSADARIFIVLVERKDCFVAFY